MTYLLSERPAALYRPTRAPGRGWAPNDCVAVGLGLGYLIAGIVAAAIWTGTEMAVSDVPQAVGFSPVRTLAYLGLGVVLLMGTMRGSAKRVNSVLGAGYLAVGVVCITVGCDGSRLLTLSHFDSLVHLCTAALLLGFGRTQD